jgi:hypothetical protein
MTFVRIVGFGIIALMICLMIAAFVKYRPRR